MDKLVAGYTQGYTKALLDVKAYFETHSEAIKHNKLWNAKGVIKILDALIENREEMRETSTVKLTYTADKKLIRSDKNDGLD